MQLDFGEMSILDLVLVARSFGAGQESLNWNSATDLNNEGVVDIAAPATVGTNFGS